MGARHQPPFWQGVLRPPATSSARQENWFLGGIFPGITVEWVTRACDRLWWNQHGGSGYGGLTLACFEQMDADRLIRHLELVDENRRAEARALEEARRKK